MAPFHPVPWRVWPGLLIANLGVCTLVGCLILTLLKTGHIQVPPNLKAPGENFSSSPLVLILGAGLTEEFLFRGVLLKGFLRRYPRGLAIGLSAVLFGLAHGNLGQFISATTFGIFIGWVFAETGSLWPCVVAHGLGNGMPDSWDPAFGLRLGAYPEPYAWVIAVGATALGVYWLWRGFRSQSHRAWCEERQCQTCGDASTVVQRS